MDHLVTIFKFPNIYPLDIQSRAIMWNIWLERNNCIFHLLAFPYYTMIIKIANLLLYWFLAATNPQHQSLNEASQRINRSLNFWSTRVSDHPGDTDHTTAKPSAREWFNLPPSLLAGEDLWHLLAIFIFPAMVFSFFFFFTLGPAYFGSASLLEMIY